MHIFEKKPVTVPDMAPEPNKSVMTHELEEAHEDHLRACIS